MYLAEFQKTGGALAAAGLAEGSSGNLSLRCGGELIITRSGSRLSALMQPDLVITGLNTDYITTSPPSSELAVHRAIYQTGCAEAVVHAHPPWALSLAALGMPLPGGVPLIKGGSEIVPGAFAGEISAGLRSGGLVMVGGHGSFAAAGSLAEACRLTLDFEDTCHQACAGHCIEPKQAEEKH